MNKILMLSNMTSIQKNIESKKITYKLKFIALDPDLKYREV